MPYLQKANLENRNHIFVEAPLTLLKSEKTGTRLVPNFGLLGSFRPPMTIFLALMNGYLRIGAASSVMTPYQNCLLDIFE